MPRQARIVLPGVAHHITQRGNYRQDVFSTDEDRRVYLRYLRQSAVSNGLDVSTYCLMTNHIHLIATPQTQFSLSKALGRTHLMYAQYVNRVRGNTGHLWQARFYSCPLDDDHAYNAALYVELNPVRAKMVRAPWRHPWSSAAAHCGTADDLSGLLDLSAWFKKITPDWWKTALKSGIGDSDDLERMRVHTRTGRPLGDDRFLRRVEKYLNRSVRTRQRGRPIGSKDSYQRTRSKRTHA